MFSVKYSSRNRNIFSLIETLAVLRLIPSSVLVGWSSVQLHFSDACFEDWNAKT